MAQLVSANVSGHMADIIIEGNLDETVTIQFSAAEHSELAALTVQKTAKLRRRTFGARLMHIQSVHQEGGTITMVFKAMPAPVPARTF